jgi:hypothetical protein
MTCAQPDRGASASFRSMNLEVIVIKFAGLALTLFISTAAVAQYADAPDSYTPAPGMTAVVPVPDDSAPGGLSTQVITTPASGKVVQPSNANPRIDDHGIAVISDPAVVPNGWNGVTGQAAMGGPIDDTADVQTMPTRNGAPLCSRTVTDHCIESYRQDYTGQ